MNSMNAGEVGILPDSDGDFWPSVGHTASVPVEAIDSTIKFVHSMSHGQAGTLWVVPHGQRYVHFLCRRRMLNGVLCNDIREV